MEQNRVTQDTFEAMLAAVPDDRWGTRSMCSDWTIRDVAGHVIWGQHQMRAWATGEQNPHRAGAPGMPSPRPAEMTGADPVATWREARATSLASLTDETLARTVSIAGFGEMPVIGLVQLLVVDTAVHTWDIGHALGRTVEFHPGVLAAMSDWAGKAVERRPGFFGPELTPPAGADAQTRLLAHLGRAPWEPAIA